MAGPHVGPLQMAAAAPIWPLQKGDRKCYIAWSSLDSYDSKMLHSFFLSRLLHPLLLLDLFFFPLDLFSSSYVVLVFFFSSFFLLFFCLATSPLLGLISSIYGCSASGLEHGILHAELIILQMTVADGLEPLILPAEVILPQMAVHLPPAGLKNVLLLAKLIVLQMTVY